jgi:copper chaperone
LIGIESYDVSLEKQEVIVKTGIDYETILAKIKKTGKEVKSGETIAA